MFYEIFESPKMTDLVCNSLVQQLQKLAGNTFVVVRVYSWPHSPIICSGTSPSGTKMTVIDPANSQAGQEACKTIP